MTQNTATQRPLLSFAETVDVDQWSGRLFTTTALLAVFRIIWVICQTSGVFSKFPAKAPKWVSDFEKGLGLFLLAYLAFGLVFLIFAIFKRLHSESNDPISNLVLNYVASVVFVGVAARVSYVVIDSPLPFFTWANLFQIGAVRGGSYALIALGYTLVYGILFMINFAHGEVMMLGAYGGWFGMMYMIDGGNRSFESGAAIIASWVVPVLVALLFLPLEDLLIGTGKRHETGVNDPRRIFTLLSLPVRLGLGAAVGAGILFGLGAAAPNIYLVLITLVGMLFIILTAMATSSFVAVVLERIAYRPLRRAPRLTPLISAIGASIFLQQVALRMFGPRERIYTAKPQILNDPVTIALDLGTLGVVPINKVGLVMTLVALGLMALLFFIVRRTKLGRAMRAVAEDKDTAALMGADVDRVIVLTFILGASLAGAAGSMLGFYGQQVSSRFGFTYGLKAFTAAVLGGIGNIPGAMLGGFFLGTVEALGPTALGLNNSWQNAISFLLLVLVIIFRPKGILGEATAEKKV